MFRLEPVILAAGRSRRFAGDKLLAPITVGQQSQPMIVHTLSVWLSVFEHVTLVVRPDHQLLIQLLSDFEHADRLNLVYSEDADKGMGHSLSAAVSATKDASAWLIGLADMPALSPQTLSLSASYLQKGAAITVPFYQGRQGHPVGFSSAYQDELSTLQGDRGAKSILQREQHLIQPVGADKGSVMDIDSYEDKAIFTASFQ